MAPFMQNKTRKPLFPQLGKIIQIFFGKCRIVLKNAKRGPLGFIDIHSVAKYQKTRRGDSFEAL